MKAFVACVFLLVVACVGGVRSQIALSHTEIARRLFSAAQLAGVAALQAAHEGVQILLGKGLLGVHEAISVSAVVVLV